MPPNNAEGPNAASPKPHQEVDGLRVNQVMLMPVIFQLSNPIALCVDGCLVIPDDEFLLPYDSIFLWFVHGHPITKNLLPGTLPGALACCVRRQQEDVSGYVAAHPSGLTVRAPMVVAISGGELVKQPLVIRVEPSTLQCVHVHQMLSDHVRPYHSESLRG